MQIFNNLESYGRVLAALIYYGSIFATFWFGVCLLILVISGWFSLTSRFRHSEKIVGKRFYFESMRLGLMSGYRNCVTLVLNDSGVGIRIWRLFCPFHNQIFLSWSDIGGCKPGWFFILRPYWIELHDGTKIGIYNRRVANAVMERITPLRPTNKITSQNPIG